MCAHYAPVEILQNVETFSTGEKLAGNPKAVLHVTTGTDAWDNEEQAWVIIGTV